MCYEGEGTVAIEGAPTLICKEACKEDVGRQHKSYPEGCMEIRDRSAQHGRVFWACLCACSASHQELWSNQAPVKFLPSRQGMALVCTKAALPAAAGNTR